MVSLHSLLCASIAILGAIDFTDAAQFRPRDADKWLMSAYDYLIVGGGASGMTVARRLAETPGGEYFELDTHLVYDIRTPILTYQSDGPGH